MLTPLVSAWRMLVGLVLGAPGLGLEDVGVLGLGLILGILGLGLDEVVMLGPGLVLDTLGLGLVVAALVHVRLPLRIVWGRGYP